MPPKKKSTQNTGKAKGKAKAEAASVPAASVPALSSMPEGAGPSSQALTTTRDQADRTSTLRVFYSEQSISTTITVDDDMPIAVIEDQATAAVAALLSAKFPRIIYRSTLVLETKEINGEILCLAHCSSIKPTEHHFNIVGLTMTDRTKEPYLLVTPYAGSNTQVLRDAIAELRLDGTDDHLRNKVSFAFENHSGCFRPSFGAINLHSL